MKQLIQSYKTGELGLFEVPAPICNENGALIQTSVSLVSAGTEKMIVDIAKKSLVGKAKARPDLVKQVVDKMKKPAVFLIVLSVAISNSQGKNLGQGHSSAYIKA